MAQTTATPKPVQVTMVEYPVYPKGVYTTVLAKVEGVERTPYRAADDAPKEPAIKWSFEAFTIDEKTKVKVPVLHDDEPVVITIITGVNYGGSRSSCTKIINGLCGRKLEKSELANLDFVSMCGTEATIMLTVEENEGKERNRIADVERMDKTPLPAL